MITLFKSYFTIFDEDSLRNNFVLIYELLDGALAPLLPVASAPLTRVARRQKSWTTGTRRSWRQRP